MERRTTMTRNVFSFAGVAGLFIAVALLAGCYAPLANQDGYLNLTIEGARGGTNVAIVLVVNADYKDSFKELLWLIDKGQDSPGSFSGSDTDRLTELAKLMATSGLVKFGGFPFFQTTMSGASGSFQISGVPAGREYFVKLLVFPSGFSFKVQDIDKNFGGLIQFENPVFGPIGSEVYTTTWGSWPAGQSVQVKSGKSATINVTLGPVP
jgi:hypothetical protein